MAGRPRAARSGSTQLVQQIAKMTAPDSPFGTAQVTAVGATLTIKLRGTPLSGIHRLASYATPVVGDVVFVATTKGQVLVLGKIT